MINMELDSRFERADTPRTNAAEHNMGSVAEPHYVVDVEDARDLERELVEARAEVVRLKWDAESWEQVFDKTCQLLAEAKEELAEAVAKERERCAKVCEGVENSMYWIHNKRGVAQDCAAAIRKGE